MLLKNIKSKATANVVLLIFLFLAVAGGTLVVSLNSFKNEDNKQIQVGYNTYYQVVDDIGYYVIDEEFIAQFYGFYKACIEFDKQDVKKIVIILNSPGGSVFDALGVIDLMEEQKAKGRIVEVRGYGTVSSAAAFTMAAGSPGYRYMAKNAFLMIHGVVGQPKETEEIQNLRKWFNEKLIKMMAKYTNLTELDLWLKFREDSWADAATAIKWGFVDKII